MKRDLCVAAPGRTGTSSCAGQHLHAAPRFSSPKSELHPDGAASGSLVLSQNGWISMQTLSRLQSFGRPPMPWSGILGTRPVRLQLRPRPRTLSMDQDTQYQAVITSSERRRTAAQRVSCRRGEAQVPRSAAPAAAGIGDGALRLIVDHGRFGRGTCTRHIHICRPRRRMHTTSPFGKTGLTERTRRQEIVPVIIVVLVGEPSQEQTSNAWPG